MFCFVTLGDDLYTVDAADELLEKVKIDGPTGTDDTHAVDADVSAEKCAAFKLTIWSSFERKTWH